MTNEQLLARAQAWLSVLIILGYFGLWVLVGYHVIPIDAPRDVFPLVALVAFFWFQRTRPHSADDPQPGTDAPASPVFTKPPLELKR